MKINSEYDLNKKLGLEPYEEEFASQPENVDLEGVPVYEDSQMALPEQDYQITKGTPLEIPEAYSEMSDEESDDTKEPKKQSLEDMFQEYLSLKGSREQALKEARERDRQINFAQDLNKAFQQIGTGLASGYANVKMQPIDFGKSDEEARLREQQKGRLSDLLSEYKIQKELTPGQSDKKYFNTADGIVEIDKKTGKVNLVRESEIKKKREDRLQEQFDFSKEVKSRLSDKEVKDITAFDDGARILDDIENVLKTTDVDKDLGPYASRIENLSDLIPFVEQDPDFVKMQQLVGIQLADYVKSISGAQVSEQEAQRLLKNIPNMTDKPNAFKIKLNTFRKELEEAKDEYLSNIGIQKKSAEKFKKGNIKKESYDSKTKSAKTRVKLPNGQVGSIDSDKVDSFLQKYPNAQIME